ncbi:MAG: hypothetical protein Q9165_000422 [Trypethelium subeluteriae]
MSISQTYINVRGGTADELPNAPGMSTCLHEKYCEVSQKMGCNSYWVHTACVPVDQTMRDETMRLINAVFEDSKLTLICDDKVISLEAPETKQREITFMEKLLATFLVCGWNLGAWSLLEAFKGAKNLQLLCQNDTLVSLYDVISFVHEKGSVELSNLALSLYFLLRPNEVRAFSSKITTFSDDSTNGIFDNNTTRAMAIEEAGHLLSHRHVRDDDEKMLIWSLLIGIPPTNIASQFWSYIVEVRTGYLVSSMPSVAGAPNLSWAPSSPDHASDATYNLIYQRQRSFWHAEQTVKGSNTARGESRLRGLDAVWHFCRLDDLRLGRADGSPTDDLSKSSELVDSLTLAIITSEQDDQFGATWRWHADNAETHAWDMLSRLPEFPPELPLEEFMHLKIQNVDRTFPQGYTMIEQAGELSDWSRLKVVSLIDGCTIRLALAISNVPATAQDASLGHSIKLYLDSVVKLLDIVCDDQLSYVPKARHARAVLIAFLWAMWQSESKITLVCDRDLTSMSLPSGDDDVAQAERLLATLLVCDWNVRAWTLLESVRGRRNIHVLCAKNQTVSVNELIKMILDKGAVDVAILGLVARHLLDNRMEGRYSVVNAGAILSHRYATRDGDDVVIWSLMCARRNSDVTSDASVFWKSKEGYFLNTGYLVSSVPRLTGTKGFNWAPCSPNVRSQGLVLQNEVSDNFFSDGNGSEVGVVTAKGLEAIWLVYQIKAGDDEKYSQSTDGWLSGVPDQEQGIQSRGHVLNACWKRVQELQQMHPRVCLLMPKSQSTGRHFGSEQSKKQDPMVVTAFSTSRTIKVGKTYEDEWTWAGVCEWPSQVALPEMEWEKILLT